MTSAGLAAGLGAGRQRATTGAVLAGVEAVLVWRIGWSAALAAFMYLGALGVVVSVIDLHTHRLPNRIVLPSYPVVVALLAPAAGMQGRWWPLGRAAIGMVLVAGFYLVLGLAFEHGLGLGDPLTELLRPSGGATIPRFGTGACSDRVTAFETRTWPCKPPDATPSSWWWRLSGRWWRSTIRGAVSGWWTGTAVRWTR